MEVYFVLVVFFMISNAATKAALQNKLVVNCLNTPNNNGKYFVNAIYADTSRGWRSQAIRGTCKPGTFYVHNLNERIGYVWVKGESHDRAYIKVTSQQMLNGKYMYETWSYKGRSAFSISSSTSNIKETFNYLGFPIFIRCDGKDGRDKNGYCELNGPIRTQLNTAPPPYSGTVFDVKVQPILPKSAFWNLKYQKITKGGAIYGHYWDYRNNKWNSDDCYTFEAQYLDGHSFEVTCPVKDFKSSTDAKAQAVGMLEALGLTPKYMRSFLKTIAINGGGPGSRAGANSHRKSMTINLDKSNIDHAYDLFLHEGAHVGLLYIQNSPKWKAAQSLDQTFISSYAKSNPQSEDVSESVGPWMLVKLDPNSAQSKKIIQTIPNRLAVFDDLVCSKYPRDYCDKI